MLENRVLGEFARFTQEEIENFLKLVPNAEALFPQRENI